MPTRLTASSSSDSGPDQLNFTYADLSDYPELWEHLHELEDQLADWQAHNQLLEQESQAFEELQRPRFPYNPNVLSLTFFAVGLALGLSLH